MGDDKLEIIITAVDNASKVLSGVGDAAKGVFAVGMGVATAAAGALAAGLAYSIGEAMEAQTIQAQLAAVLESTGGAAGWTADMANDLATELSGVTRFSDEAVLSAENMLLTFTNIGAEVFPMATEAVLDMATATGVDAQSAAVQLGKALNDPVNGITALTRVGVTFTDEQKAMIQSMVDAGDVAGAQALILAELQTEFGGSAEAAGQTFAGQLDILKNSVSNVAEGVGTALLPVLSSLMNDIVIPLVPTLQTLGEQFGTLITAVFNTGLTSDTTKTALAAIFGEETAAGIMSVVQWFVDLGTAISDFVTTVIVPFVTEHWESLKTALIAIGAVIAAAGVIGAIIAIGSALASLANPITLIAALVGLLAFAWAEDFGGIRTTLTAWWEETGKPIFETLKAWLAENIPLAIETLKSFWLDTLQPALQSFWDWVVATVWPLLQQLWDWLGVAIPEAIDTLVGFWEDTLKPALEDFWDRVESDVFPLFEDLWDWLEVSIPDAIETLVGFWEDTLQPALETVWEWMNDSLFPALSTLWEWLGTTISDAVTTLSDLWTNTLQPALLIVWTFINESLVPLFTALWDLFSTAGSLAITALQGLWENVLLPALLKVGDYISTTLGPIWDALVAFFEDTFGPIVQDMSDTFLPGLQAAFDGIASAVGTVIGWIEDLVDILDDIELPEWLQPGSPTPFELGLRGISSAMQELVSGALPSFRAELDATGSSAGKVFTTNNNTNITLNASYVHQPEENLARSVQTLATIYGAT